jgi:hypothetical protein
MLLPIVLSRFPILINNAMPTARFQLGAMLLPNQDRQPMRGGYTPAGMPKRKAYVKPGNRGWGTLIKPMKQRQAMEYGMTMKSHQV